MFKAENCKSPLTRADICLYVVESSWFFIFAREDSIRK